MKVLSLKEFAKGRHYVLIAAFIVLFLALTPYTKRILAEQNEIGIKFSYADNESYGIIPMDKVVYFTVGNTEFTSPLNESKLATKYEIYSLDENKSTLICYGSEIGCNFIGLSASSDNWNDRLALYFGRYGATYNNIVSARVMYVEYNLSPQNPYSKIFYSEPVSLDATFIGLMQTLITSLIARFNCSKCNLTGAPENSFVNVFVAVQGNITNENLTLYYQKTWELPKTDEFMADSYNETYNKIVWSLHNERDLVERYFIVKSPRHNDFNNDYSFPYFTLNFSGELHVQVYASDFINVNTTQSNGTIFCNTIPNITIEKNQNGILNLGNYCNDTGGGNLTYSYYINDNENINLSINNDTAQITPLHDYIGTTYLFFIANNSRYQTATNLIKLEVAQNSISENLAQNQALIGKPVRWRKTVKSFFEKENLSINVPDGAFNLTFENITYNKKSGINDTKISIRNDTKISIRHKGRMTYNETSVLIGERTKEFAIEYQTSPPEKQERRISNSKKEVKIISEIHYENVVAYSDIDESQPSTIRLYWIKNGTREIFENVTYQDTNGNGFIDRIEWVVPHLSNQTFEIELTIINIQSYPTVGGNWTVAFLTAGNANLTITASNGTTYAEKAIDDSSTSSDLDILELKCGESILFNWNSLAMDNNAYLINENSQKLKLNDTLNQKTGIKSLFFENFSCENKTAYWTVKVITQGRHTQRFDFGTLSSYANNYALNGLVFLDDADSDFNQGTLHLTNITGSGAYGNVTLNFTINNTFKSYQLKGNFTSRIFNSGQNHTEYDRIAWNVTQVISSDIMGMAMDSIGRNITVYYRNGTHRMSAASILALTSGPINFTNRSFTYSMPADISRDDIVSIDIDEDASDAVIALLRNGTALNTTDLGANTLGQNTPFTVYSTYSITPAGFNRSDIIGFAIDTTANNAAIFFRNGSYVSDTTRDNPPFTFATVLRYNLPSGFNATTPIDVVMDDANNDITMFFTNGSYVVDSTQTDFTTDISFTNAMGVANYPLDVNVSESTNITMLSRVSNDSTVFGQWDGFYNESNGTATILGNKVGRYIQYQALLSSSSPRVTPYLENVSINYTIDVIVPVVNSSLNNSVPKIGENINISVNTSDASGVTFCQFIDNMSISGSRRFFNYSISGQNTNCSQNWTIILTRGNVINFTLIVNDTYNNKNQTDYIITVANTPPANLQLIYPTNDLKVNRQPLGFNVTFKADPDGDVMNLSYYINGIRNQSSLTNVTFNASDGVYFLNVSLSDGFANTSNISINFTLDTNNPVINGSLNKSYTAITIYDVINFTFNVTDNIGLANGTIIINDTGSKRYFNFSFNGAFTAQFSQNITINCTRNCVVNVTGWVNDTTGNYRQNETLFIVNNTPPIQPTILFPINNTVFGNQPLDINITFPGDLDNDTITISYYINGILNQTSLTNTTLNASNGAYVLNISLWDGNISTSNATINFTIDTLVPAFTSRNPVNDSYSQPDLSFRFTAVDANPYGATLYFNRTGIWAANQSLNFSPGIETSFNLTHINESFIIWGISINDTAGNTNTTQNFSLKIDGMKPRINASIYNLAVIRLNDVVNLTANVSDDFGLSFCQFIDNETLPDGAKQYINKTVTGTNDQCSQNYTIYLNAGDVINFTVIVNDTANNINQSLNRTDGGAFVVGQIVTVQITPESEPPMVNTSFNVTSPKINDIINFTGNITDNTGLLSANITYNMSGELTKINFSVSGLSEQVSNVTRITTSRGSVINFTMYATDTNNNVHQNSTLIVVADTPTQVFLGINQTEPRINYPINVSGNCTDADSQFSSGIISYNVSGNPKLNFSFDLSAGGTSGNFSKTILINLTRGNVINFTVFCNDTYGTIYQNSTLIIVNDTPPLTPTILFPANYSVQRNQPLDLNVTYPADPDNDVITINYYINGVINQSSLVNTTLNASDGAFILNVSISDGFNMSLNDTVNFTIDTLVPAFSSRNRANNSLSNSFVTFSFTATDANPYAAVLYFNKTGVWIKNQTLNFTPGAEMTFNATVMNESFMVWAITINDTAGNYNTTENFTLIVDSINPGIYASIYNSTGPRITDVINITANVSDEYALSFCQFIDNETLPNGAKQFINKTVSGTNDQCSQNYTIYLNRGNVINFTVIVNDTANNTNQTIIIFTVNDFISTPVILFPFGGMEIKNQPLDFNVTFPSDEDGDIVNISYYINGIRNQSSLTNTTFNASNGFYVLNVSTFDGANSSANATINFTLDTAPPNITLFVPYNHSVQNSSIIDFRFNVTDANTVPNCSLTINNDVESVLPSIVKGSLNTISLTLPNDNYNWSVNCTDLAENVNFSVFRNFTVNAPPLMPTKFIDTSDIDFGQGSLHFTNMTGIGQDANVTLNFTTNNTFKAYGYGSYLSGNFTSRIFDAGANNTNFTTIIWTQSLRNSSDIIGIAIDSVGLNATVFYRNLTHRMMNGTRNTLAGDINFTNRSFTYSLPSTVVSDDIVGISTDDDPSDTTVALLRNGTALETVDMTANTLAQNLPFTIFSTYTITPAGFNTSDIVGFALDTTANDVAIFFRNGSYVTDTTTDLPPYTFANVLTYTLPAGYSGKDAIAVETDDSANQLAMFFRNGSYVLDTAQTSFLAAQVVSFTNGEYRAYYPDDANLTETTNITMLTRVSNDSVVFTDWSTGVYNPDWERIIGGNGRYIQYRALLSTPSKFNTPYLMNVTINYTERNNPKINFAFPTLENNTFEVLDWIFINTSVIDEHSIDSCILEFNGINASMLIARDGRNNSCFLNKTSLSEGAYSFKVYANDSFGNANSTDYRNITIDSTSPVVSLFLIKPNPANFTFSTVSVNFTVFDLNLNLTIANVTYPNRTTLSINYSNFTLTPLNLSVPGNYSIYLFANDSAGNHVNATDFLIVNDVVPPNVSLITPINNTITGNATVFFTYIPQDDYNVSNCTIVFNGIANITNNTIDESISNNFTVTLPEGMFIWYVNCTDNYLNTNYSESRILTVDTSPPNATLAYPVNDFNASVDSINFNWTAVDNFDINISCNLTINNVVIGINLTNMTSNYTNFTAYNLTEGYNFWNVTCIDDANNTNTSIMRNFTLLKGPATLNITLADDNETINLSWNPVSYAEAYNIYIVDNYSNAFGPLANVSLITSTNYSDPNGANKTTRFYRIATVKGSANATTVKTVGKYEFELINNSNEPTDWNLLSLPLNLTNFLLFNGSNNGSDLRVKPLYCIKTLWFYNATTKQFKRTDYNGSAWIPAADSTNFTSLSLGRGYWAEVNQTCNITFVGEVPLGNISVELAKGWNLVGWYSPNSSGLPANQNPPYPILVYPPNSVKAIDRYDPLRDRFEVTVHFNFSGIDWGWFPSSNNRGFTTIDPTRGYYYDVLDDSSWAYRPNS